MTKINIITRTSNRPNGFKRCVESINNQTYKNVSHYVCYDIEADLTYIEKENLSIKPTFIDRKELIENDKTPDMGTGKYSPHNLYFNTMLEKIDDGWVILLDDDDYFTSNKAIEEIVKAIEEEDADDKTIVMWQMNFVNNRVLPPKSLLGKKPVLATIGTPCFSFNINNLGNAKWDGWKCGDFRFISKIYSKADRVITIEKPLIQLDQLGFGNRGDIPSSKLHRTILNLKYRLNTFISTIVLAVAKPKNK